MSVLVTKQHYADPLDLLVRDQPSSAPNRQADNLAPLGKSNASENVAILLATYNGESFLSDQLESIAAQSHLDWKIWASDDGSQDDTLNILNQYRDGWGDTCLSICEGPAKGFVANFLSLVCNSEIEADYYAFADQDDVWDKDKLSRAISWLRSVPKHVPALYCSRTRLVDANNHEYGFSPLFTKSPSFSNALVQNIAGGNTMVFNDAARQLLMIDGKSIPVAAHDWLAYLVVSGCGGKVFYDSEPTIRYRQHGTNTIGSAHGWAARILRVRLLFQGRFRNWNEKNIQALQQIRPYLSPQNRFLLDQFINARQSRFFPRLLGMKRCNIHRQTLLGNLGLIAAVLLRKV